MSSWAKNSVTNMVWQPLPTTLIPRGNNPPTKNNSCQFVKFVSPYTRMAFKDFPSHELSIQLLQRTLERGRLAHAYLFSGAHLDELEAVARTLAKTLNCQQPVRKDGKAIDSCDKCPSCRKIEQALHADVYWIRPE